MHPDAEATLDQVRQALDRRVSGEIVAGAPMGAGGAWARRQVVRGTGAGPRLGRHLLLAATMTRLVLFDAEAPSATATVRRPTRLRGDWPLDLTTIDATKVRTPNPRGLAGGMWAVVVSVPSDDVETVLECPASAAVDELVATLAAITGGHLAA